MPGRPRAALAMWPDSAEAVFDVDTLRALGEVCDLVTTEVLHDFTAARDAPAEVEVLITGWGCPPLTGTVLARAPEYTVAMILLTGKRILERARDHRVERREDDWLRTSKSIGNHGRTIGILSASTIGRRVVELLRPFDFHVLLHDPFVTEADAAALGVDLVDLDELFTRSDLVSVHTPLLPETRGLVSRALIAAMPPDAVLLNTARGAVVDQDALTEAL